MTTETLEPPTSPAARITGMRCRNCGRTEPIGLSYVCPGCFGPLEVAYDYDLIGRTLTRDVIERRGPGIWRFAELLPVDAPPKRGLAVGSIADENHALGVADGIAALLGFAHVVTWLGVAHFDAFLALRRMYFAAARRAQSSAVFDHAWKPRARTMARSAHKG